jgi:hypothetical protein
MPILIENESNWRTEDLRALVEAVAGKAGTIRCHNWNDETLLLFKTSRRRDKPYQSYKKGGDKAPAVALRRKNNPYFNTRVVEIATSKKLKMKVLDRLAHVGADGQQDMSSNNVIQLASTIRLAICGSRRYEDPCKWAANYQMRARPKTTKSKLALDRRIAKLRDDQRLQQVWADIAISDLEKKIRALYQTREKL